MALFLALPLGELSPQVTERAYFFATARRTASAIALSVRPYSSASRAGVPLWPKRSWMPTRSKGTQALPHRASATAPPRPPPFPPHLLLSYTVFHSIQCKWLDFLEESTEIH